MGKAVIAIHGGAGAITRAQMSQEQEQRYIQALSDIVETGQKMLEAGESALDVVTEAVRLLEECPLFNAGIGAVYTRDATHELDACVMDGNTLNAGAVAGVRHLRNPVLAARLVMEQSPYVLMVGDGAEAFAASRGMERVSADLFSTPERYAQLLAARDAGEMVLDHSGAPLDETTKMGTVGAVARDRFGNLAAATSTGGMTNKLPGRVGDSPLVGGWVLRQQCQRGGFLYRNGRGVHPRIGGLRYRRADGLRRTQPGGSLRACGHGEIACAGRQRWADCRRSRRQRRPTF
ncbi:L-asparaginase [Citrobacter koseri]|nr:L-asparaginase [Citrobacter koseri]